VSRRDSPEWADHIMGALNYLDWIEGIIMGIVYRDITPHRIAVPHPDGDFWETFRGAFWNAGSTKRLLKSFGVRVYWHGFNGREVFFHVSKRQAVWADTILARAGVPTTTPEHDPRRSRSGHSAGPMYKTWRQQGEERRRTAAQKRRQNRPGLWARIRKAAK